MRFTATARDLKPRQNQPLTQVPVLVAGVSHRDRARIRRAICDSCSHCNKAFDWCMAQDKCLNKITLHGQCTEGNW